MAVVSEFTDYMRAIARTLTRYGTTWAAASPPTISRCKPHIVYLTAAICVNTATAETFFSAGLPVVWQERRRKRYTEGPTSDYFSDLRWYACKPVTVRQTMVYPASYTGYWFTTDTIEPVYFKSHLVSQSLDSSYPPLFAETGHYEFDNFVVPVPPLPQFPPWPRR